MKRTLLSLLALLMTTLCYAQDLPQATVRDLSGKPVETSTFLQSGKPFIVTFFGTWCKPCNRELKAIDEVYADWQAETGAKLVAVSIDQAQNINKVKPLVDENGWTYDVLLDPNGELKRALGIQMIPYTLVLDGSGNIVFKHNGYTDGAEEELYKQVKAACKK